jgi:hypothetical protein
MSIQLGTLEFDVLFETGQIYKGLKTTETLVKNFMSLTNENASVVDEAYKRVASNIDKGFDTLHAAIRNEKDGIKELVKEYDKLAISADNLKKFNPERYMAIRQQQKGIQGQIEERKEILKEYEREAAALEKLNSKLGNHKSQFDNATHAQVRFRTELLNVKQKMMELAQSGKQATPEYASLAKEAERLQNAMLSVNQQVKILTSTKGATLQGIVSGLSGISGAFTAAQGAMGLFAGENEELQKIMLRVQSLMSITIGLQAVSTTLHQTSAFRISVLTKAQIAYSSAVRATGTALVRLGVSANVARVAAQAFMATATLGLSAAITGLVFLISKFEAKSREAKKAVEEFNKTTAETASKPIIKINELSLAWSRLGNNIKAKEKFIDNNKSKFDALGVSVKNAAEAEKLLIDNKEKFIAAQMLKAKAMAATELASEKYKIALEKMQTVESEPAKYIGAGKYSGIPFDKESINQMFGKSKTIDQLLSEGIIKSNKAWEKWEQKKMEFQRDLDSAGAQFLKMAVGFTEQEQKILAEIGQSSNKDKDKGKAGKDTVSKELDERKKAYQKYFAWLNAGFAKEAQEEFAELLKGGGSYEEYLNNQISILRKLQDEGTITANQLEKLHKATTALAEETKNTVLQEFEKGLQAELDNARSVLEMLAIIEQRRKDLEIDESGLTTQKNIVLDKHQEDVVKKATDETDQLLKDYADYLDNKISRAIAHESKMRLLRNRAAKVETREEREKINNLMALYEQMYDAGIDNFHDLEQINEESISRFGTFEQKRLQIIKDYEQQIQAARIAGQEDLAKKLEGERDLEILKETQQYKEFFDDVSEISIKTLENTRRALLAIMKEAYNAGKLTVEQYKQLINEINDQADNAYRGRGMEALFGNSRTGGFMNMMFGEGDIESKISSFKTLFSGAKGDMASMVGTSGKVAGNAGSASDAMQGAAGGAASTLAIIDAIITAIYQTLRAVSDTLNVIAEYQDSIGNSNAAESLSDVAAVIDSINETAMSGWENLKNGNIMGAISDTVSMVFKLLTTLNRIHDKKIEKSIQEHAKHIRQLETEYKKLEREVDKALGGERYSSQKSELENLKKQQEEYNAMAQAERRKKKADTGKIEEYENAAHENAMKMLDIVDKIRESIAGNAESIANDLGNAFIDAFAAGENAMDAFKKKADDIVAGIIRKMLIQKLLEQPIGQILDRYAKRWYSDDGTFIGFDTVIADAAAMGNELKGIGADFATAMENLPEEIRKYLIGTQDPQEINSLSGAIKGITQEQADLLGGTANAILKHQVEGVEILRNQLLHLASIDMKIGVSNQLLEQIEQNTKTNPSDPLRAQGITG